MLCSEVSNLKGEDSIPKNILQDVLHALVSVRGERLPFIQMENTTFKDKEVCKGDSEKVRAGLDS